MSGVEPKKTGEEPDRFAGLYRDAKKEKKPEDKKVIAAQAAAAAKAGGAAAAGVGAAASAGGLKVSNFNKWLEDKAKTGGVTKDEYLTSQSTLFGVSVEDYTEMEKDWFVTAQRQEAQRTQKVGGFGGAAGAGGASSSSTGGLTADEEAFFQEMTKAGGIIITREQFLGMKRDWERGEAQRSRQAAGTGAAVAAGPKPAAPAPAAPPKEKQPVHPAAGYGAAAAVSAGEQKEGAFAQFVAKAERNNLGPDFQKFIKSKVTKMGMSYDQFIEWKIAIYKSDDRYLKAATQEFQCAQAAARTNPNLVMTQHQKIRNPNGPDWDILWILSKETVEGKEVYRLKATPFDEVTSEDMEKEPGFSSIIANMQNQCYIIKPEETVGNLRDRSVRIMGKGFLSIPENLIGQLFDLKVIKLF